MRILSLMSVVKVSWPDTSRCINLFSFFPLVRWSCFTIRYLILCCRSRFHLLVLSVLWLLWTIRIYWSWSLHNLIQIQIYALVGFFRNLLNKRTLFINCFWRTLSDCTLSCWFSCLTLLLATTFYFSTYFRGLMMNQLNWAMNWRLLTARLSFFWTFVVNFLREVSLLFRFQLIERVFCKHS